MSDIPDSPGWWYLEGEPVKVIRADWPNGDGTLRAGDDCDRLGHFARGRKWLGRVPTPEEWQLARQALEALTVFAAATDEVQGDASYSAGWSDGVRYCGSIARAAMKGDTMSSNEGAM